MKGQITLFIALGLILLGAVGIILFLFNEQAQVRTVDQVDVESSVTQIRQCLFTTGIEAIEYIGSQGGSIFRADKGEFLDQNGTVFPRSTLNLTFAGEDTTIEYAILESDAALPPPNYPYGNASFRLNTLLRAFPGFAFFGKNTLTPLCDRIGPNSPDQIVNLTCQPYAYGYDNFTIQSQIRTHLLRHAPACMQPHQLDGAEVIFAASDVIVAASATVNNIPVYHEVAIPVRLRHVYELMYAILQNDIIDPQFDKTQDYRNLFSCSSGFCWDNQLFVYNLRNVYGATQDEQFDDVLRIEDNASIVNGRPFVFQVGIQNRRPMLDYVFSPGSREDIDVQIGEVLRIEPTGYDPDEDNLTYLYDESWKLFMSSTEYVLESECLGDEVSGRCSEVGLDTGDIGVRVVKVSVFDGNLEDFQNVRVRVDP